MKAITVNVLVVFAFCLSGGCLSTEDYGPTFGPSFYTRKPLPSHRQLALFGEGKTQINVSRSADLQQLKKVDIYNGPGNIIYAEFDAKTGHIVGLTVKVNGMYVRELKFRKDGTIEFEIAFEPTQKKGDHPGIKTYYDHKGKPRRTERIVIHHGE